MLNADALSEWLREKEIEDRRTARLMAAIYNNNPNRKKGAKVYSEADFLPKKATAIGTGNSASNIYAKVKWIHNRIHAAAKKKTTDGR